MQCWHIWTTQLKVEGYSVGGTCQLCSNLKSNFLHYYSKAWEKVFTADTIKNAWRKIGLWPLNPKAIEPSAYTPSLNTTTKPALPVTPVVPQIIIPGTPACRLEGHTILQRSALDLRPPVVMKALITQPVLESSLLVTSSNTGLDMPALTVKFRKENDQTRD